MKISRMPFSDYSRMRETCGFSDDESDILDMLRHESSVTKISLACCMSESTVKRRIRSIRQKIEQEL